MQVERGHKNLFRLTLSGYELSALISAARWVSEGAKGELTADAINNLEQILKNYDRSLSKLNDESSKKGLQKSS